MRLPERNAFDRYAAKRVSFVIITRNRADYLQKALQRHGALIHPEDELIIVDGLSSDNTAGVVREYANLVDVFVSEPDVNAVHALNKGILLSSGKYIKELTDDDVVYAEPMEQAIRVLEEHPEIDILVCGGTRQRGDWVSPVYVPPGVNYGSRLEDVFKYGSCALGFVIKRSAFSRIGLFHLNNLDADKEFALRAIRRGANVKFCRLNLFNHPIYAHSVTENKAREFDTSDRRLVRQYYSLGYYLGFRLKKWWSAGFMPWVLGHKRLSSAGRSGLRVLRTVRGRKPAAPAPPCLWDGGLS